MSEQKWITCPECKTDHELSTLLREREVKDALLEVGLLCPCGMWTHAHFTNADLKAKQQRLQQMIARYQQNTTLALWTQVQTMQDAYRKEFDEFNRRWRRKLGMMQPAS